MRPLCRDTDEEHLPACWELWKSKETSSNKVPLEKEIWVDLWTLVPETLTELEELVLEEKRHNSSETSTGGLMCSTTRLLEVMDCLECNNGGINWCMRMPRDTPPADPKGEMLLKHKWGRRCNCVQFLPSYRNLSHRTWLTSTERCE